jgi:integrase
MAPRRQPLRLYLEAERVHKNGSVTPKTWQIRGTCEFTNERIKKSTGCIVDPKNGIDQTSAAEEILADFVKQRRAAQRPSEKVKNASADEVYVADVVSYYIDNRVFGEPSDRYPKPLSRPKEVLARLEVILGFFGEMTMNELDPEVFKEFRKTRSTQEAARRPLEDLRSAINLYVEDGRMRHAVNVPLPAKLPERRDWLTRSEVRHIVKVAWYKQGVYFDEDKHPAKGFIWRHLVPYILVAVMTGSRYDRIVRASFKRRPGKPWINLETGEYWRVAPEEIEYRNKLNPGIFLPRLLIRILRRYREAGAEYVVEWKGQNATNLGKSMRKLLDEAIPDENRHIVPHTFRHTAATWLVSDPTIPLIEIANYLGMSFETIHRRYAKIRDRQGSQVAAAMDRLRKEEFTPLATKGSWRDPSNRKNTPAKAPTTFDNINGSERKRTGAKSNEKPVKSTKAA